MKLQSLHPFHLQRPQISATTTVATITVVGDEAEALVSTVEEEAVEVEEAEEETGKEATTEHFNSHSTLCVLGLCHFLNISFGIFFCYWHLLLE